MTDRCSERNQIDRLTFNFSPTRNPPVFLRFHRRVNPQNYWLVGSQL